MSQSKGKSTKDEKTKKAPSAKPKARAKSASGTKAKTSAATNSESSIRTRVIDETLRLITEKGWRQTRIEDVTAAADVSEIAFAREFGGLASVVVAASRRLNAIMLEEKADFAPDDPVRDRLFALLMARFEAARPWTSAIKELTRSAPYDPILAATGMKAMMMASVQALSGAGIRTSGPLGFARVNAFMAGVMLPVSRVWLTDESAELDKTMVALDRSLDRAEWLASRLTPSHCKRKPHAQEDANETVNA